MLQIEAGGKMARSVKLLLIILVLLATAASAEAESLTLSQCIAIALKENPILKSYSWTLSAQKEDVSIAKGRLYPNFSIEEMFQRTNNPTYSFMSKLNQERFSESDFLVGSLNDPADISNFRTSLNFNQPVFVPKIYKEISIAGKELGAKNAEYRRQVEDVTLKVLKAFNGIKTAAEYLKAANKGIEDAGEHKRIASARYDTGVGLYSDVLRAEVSVKKAEAMVIKSEADLEVSRRSLGLLLGRSEPIDIQGDNLFSSVSDLNIYLDASKERADLKALKLRYENSEQAISLEKSLFIPEAGIGGSYFYDDHKKPFSAEGESYLLMGFLRWNIFDASAYHKIKKAEADRHEMEGHLSGLEKEINFRVNEAYIRVREKAQNVTLSEAVLKEAEEALRLVRTRYQNSLAPMFDLLETQSVLDAARAQQAEVKNEHLNAVADLYYQSGILSKTIEQNKDSGGEGL